MSTAVLSVPVDHAPTIVPTHSTEPDDSFRDWAHGIRASDPQAYEAFFRAVHGSLVRYAETLVKDASLARDLTQDALVRIWERRETVDPERSLEALAYRTLKNLCLNRIRDRKNRAELLAGEYDSPVSAPPGPDRELGGTRLAERLSTWVEELPDRQREAVRLSRFQGLSHEEVAEAMGVSPRTVNNHLVRALRSLRERIRAYDPTLLDS